MKKLHAKKSTMRLKNSSNYLSTPVVLSPAGPSGFNS